MSIELRTTYRSFSPPMSAVRRIRAKLQFFETIYPEVVACSLVAELVRDRERAGTDYRVAIAVTTTDGEIIANHGRNDDHRHENLFAALADAFDALDSALHSHMADRASAMSFRPSRGRMDGP
jgi:hypothetical protein